MSVFKISGILLKKNKLKENEDILTIFTKEYGKINFKGKKTKKEKTLDLGNVINFEVNVKGENKINEIKNVRIKNEFKYDLYNYELIFEYLDILNLIEKKSPFNMEIVGVYEIIFEINNYKNITLEKILFSKAKLLEKFGILDFNAKNEKIKKVLKFIGTSQINDILKLSGLNEGEIKEFRDHLNS